MHARRVVTSRGRYLVVCTRAYAHNHFSTYQPTDLPPDLVFARGRALTILAHSGSTCSNPRAAARSRGRTGRIFAFDPLPSPPLFTSFLSHSPRRSGILPLFLMAKKKPLARGYRDTRVAIKSLEKIRAIREDSRIIQSSDRSLKKNCNLIYKKIKFLPYFSI